MSIKESMLNLWGKMRQGPVVTDGPEANLLNGGHTGYHPPVQPRQPKKTEQRRQQPQNQQQPVYDPNFYQNTGFQQDYQGSGPIYQQAGWQQAGYQTGFQQQASQGYVPFGQQQGASWQNPMEQSGPWQAQQGGTGFAQGQQAGFAQNQQQGTGFAQSQPMTGFAQNQQPAYQTEGNVTYAFGQQFRGQDGVAYSHVERLAQPLSVATCFRLIEFMRNGESIIVNLELVPDENERTRCLDMLCGAAFTMQCTFNRVASRCIYLIAPSTVQVLPYESIRQLSEQDAEERWPRDGGSVRTDVRWSERRSARQSNSPEYEERRYGFSR